MASKIEDAVWNIAEPIANGQGLEIYDVEFKKEGPDYYLRVYIDHKERGITIDDCEAVSRPLSDALDEADPISEGYYLEVSSPGVERQLKRQVDFDRYVGETINIKLFKAINGAKQFTAKLISRDDENITVETENNETLIINNKDVAVVRLAMEF